MHRTSTTATLLVTVAVTALSGCVTVQHTPASAGGPTAAPSGPSGPSVPRPDGQADTQVVQAPAREALERVAPSRQADSKAPEQQGWTAAPAEQPPAPRTRPRSRPRPHPAHPEPRHPAHPRAETPDTSNEVRRNTDVCALGRKYGGWRTDSPETAICEQTYRR